MIYQSTSIQEVMARVVRNTGVLDSRYISSMEEWIPEAMGIMNFKQATTKHWEDVYITFHRGKMPCDLHSIEAIEYDGRNLLTSNSTRMVGAPMPAFRNHQAARSSTEFVSVPQTYQVTHTDGTTGRVFDSTAQPQAFCTQSSANCHRLRPCHGEWYQVEVPGYITTSFKCGWIRVHYKRIPVDEDGLPMIPDNENLKQALYWYTRAMMVGAGWEDPIPTYRNPEVLLAKFELAAGRAASEITYPTDAELELAVRNLNKMVKDERYFDRFFETPDCHHHTHTPEISYSQSDRTVPNMPLDLILTDNTVPKEIKENPSGLINSSNKTFLASFHIIPGTLDVYINGLLQQGGLHYGVGVDLKSIVFVDAPQAPPDVAIPDNIMISYETNDIT